MRSRKVREAAAAKQHATVLARAQHNKVMEAADRRKQAHVKSVSAKGAAEASKVAKVTGTQRPKKVAPLADASSGPASPDSVLHADTFEAEPELYRVQSATTDGAVIHSEPAGKPRAFDRREATLMLTLMRFGVPNAEVLPASSAGIEALDALAQKYLIRC